MKRDMNYCYCSKCGKPVTWFNFKNIWADGKIVDREHITCPANEVLRIKQERGLE